MTFFEQVVEDFQMVHWMEFALRIIMACVCGALVGSERNNRFKDAGIRTHSIICCTAALLMMLSKYGFSDMSGLDGALYFPGIKGADPARIAGAAVSGASFLGGGIIYRDKSNLTRGLTTAAGVWSVCAIGLAIGAGFIAPALFAAIVMAVMKYVVHHLALGGAPTLEVTLEMILSLPEQTPEAVVEGMKKLNMVVQETAILSCDESQMRFLLEMKMKENKDVSAIKSLASVYGDVENIRIVHES